MTSSAPSRSRSHRLRRSPVAQTAVALTMAMVLYLVGPAVIGALGTLSNPNIFCSGAVDASGIAGTVTGAGSGDPIEGAWVAVLRTSDFSLAAGPITDAAGEFEVGVDPGSYFLYLVDPSGQHPSGFDNANLPVTVTDENVTQVQSEMTELRGSVAGTVTQDGSGDPIDSAVVLAIGGPNVAMEVLRVTDSQGDFKLPGLLPGDHFIGYVDPTGGHVAEFYPNSLSVPGADPVPVTAGSTTVADTALQPQAPTPGGEQISGTLTDSVNGEPVQYGMVVALRASDFQFVRVAFTDTAGDYSMDLVAGDYLLAFVDARGWHVQEWHDDQPPAGLGDAEPVTAPAVVDAQLAPTTGSIAGTLSDAVSGFGLGCGWVLAIGPTGIAGGAITDGNGGFRIDGLAPGTYRAAFVDPLDGRTQEYWEDSPDFDSATPFNVTAGGLAIVDEALSYNPPPNDDFAAAEELTGATGTVFGTSNGASHEVGEPDHGGGVFDRSVWYRWTAPATGQAWFDACGPFGNSASLAAYTGPAVDDLDPVPSESPSTCGGTATEISFPVTVGEEYHVAVDNPAGASGLGGSVFLRWSIGEAAPTFLGELAFDGGPYDLVVAPNGDTYVTDIINQRVVRLDPMGVVVDEFGSAGNGPGEFFDPVGIDASSSGDIYVADSSNNRVQKFSAAGDFLLEFGSAGSGNGEFFDLGDVVVDDDGDVFVSDVGNNRIQRFDADGNFVSAFGTAGFGPGELLGPGALAFAATGHLYVADDQGSSVEKYTTSGTFVQDVVSTGPGQGFLVVTGLAVDEVGALYTIDFSHDLAQKFSSTGTLLSRWGRSGVDPGEFFFPTGITVDSAGNVLVADSANGRIQAFG